MSDDSENKEINNKKEPKYSLPGNHIDIIQKKLKNKKYLILSAKY